VVPGRNDPFPRGPDGPGLPGPGLPGPDLPGPPGVSLLGTLVDLEVYAFAERARLFGWNAPDPNLLVTHGQPPPGAEDGHGDPATPYRWSGYVVGSPVEVDGDHPAVLAGSWLVLVEGSRTHVCQADGVIPGGASRWTLSGPITLVTPREDTSDSESGLAFFTRPGTAVYCASSPLPAAQAPDPAPLTGRRVTVAATDPPLPPGRRVLLSGTDAATGDPITESATVASCTVATDGASMDLELTAGLVNSFARLGLVLLANVTTATHGETVEQVLGSGPGGAGTFTTYQPRRTPLTYLRATTPDGAAAELTVRVDGVAWAQVPSLDAAGPQDRVYTLRQDEGGAVRIVAGDGVHGQRPASGQENVTATYRVGIGEPGAVDPGQLTLLPQRPLGIAAVTNPAPARDWAPPETLDEARQNAPLRVRTLDRAVSVTDYEDFARGYAGVGPARADLVWDGRAQRVLLSVLGTAATTPGSGLVSDLRATLEAARDPACPLDVLAGEPTWFGIRVELEHDPAFDRDTVLAGVTQALDVAFGAAARPFATAVTASAVLVTIKAVPGVLACTMPRLVAVTDPGTPPLPPVLPPDRQAEEALTALPGRWDDGPRPAQLLALAPGGAELREPGT
jgi:predicted phage baseplate assembly protein